MRGRMGRITEDRVTILVRKRQWGPGTVVGLIFCWWTNIGVCTEDRGSSSTYNTLYATVLCTV